MSDFGSLVAFDLRGRGRGGPALRRGWNIRHGGGFWATDSLVLPPQLLVARDLGASSGGWRSGRARCGFLSGWSIGLLADLERASRKMTARTTRRILPASIVESAAGGKTAQWRRIRYS
jgi:hypothetical protein